MVRAKFGGGTDGGEGSGPGSGSMVKVSCASCDAARELPEPDRPRMPAVHADGTTTLDADSPCTRCGSKRIRVALQLERF